MTLKLKEPIDFLAFGIMERSPSRSGKNKFIYHIHPMIRLWLVKKMTINLLLEADDVTKHKLFDGRAAPLPCQAANSTIRSLSVESCLSVKLPDNNTAGSCLIIAQSLGWATIACRALMEALAYSPYVSPVQAGWDVCLWGGQMDPKFYSDKGTNRKHHLPLFQRSNPLSSDPFMTLFRKAIITYKMGKLFNAHRIRSKYILTS